MVPSLGVRGGECVVVADQAKFAPGNPAEDKTQAHGGKPIAGDGSSEMGGEVAGLAGGDGGRGHNGPL